MFKGEAEKTKKEIFINGAWEEFDAAGDDSEESLNWYKDFYTPFAKGSFPLRYNGTIDSSSIEAAIFYRKK